MRQGAPARFPGAEPWNQAARHYLGSIRLALLAEMTFAWLFFTNPMPGGSTITVTVDGSTIRAADGSLLDATGSGTPGSKLAFRVDDCLPVHRVVG